MHLAHEDGRDGDGLREVAVRGAHRHELAAGGAPSAARLGLNVVVGDDDGHSTRVLRLEHLGREVGSRVGAVVARPDAAVDEGDRAPDLRSVAQLPVVRRTRRRAGVARLSVDDVGGERPQRQRRACSGSGLRFELGCGCGCGCGCGLGLGIGLERQRRAEGGGGELVVLACERVGRLDMEARAHLVREI